MQSRDVDHQPKSLFISLIASLFNYLSGLRGGQSQQQSPSFSTNNNNNNNNSSTLNTNNNLQQQQQNQQQHQEKLTSPAIIQQDSKINLLLSPLKKKEYSKKKKKDDIEIDSNNNNNLQNQDLESSLFNSTSSRYRRKSTPLNDSHHHHNNNNNRSNSNSDIPLTTFSSNTSIEDDNDDDNNNIHHKEMSSKTFSYSAHSPPPSTLNYNKDTNANNNNNLNRSCSNYIEIEEFGDNIDEAGSPLMSDSSIPLLTEVDNRTVLQKIIDFIKRKHIYLPRTINLELEEQTKQFPPNVVRNQKYNVYTFIFVILYEQFKYFFNLYFLIVALSQFIPPLQTGYLFTYVSPLVFVLSITILKEAYDDFQRYRRDKEANSQHYQRLTKNGFISIPSSDIKVGHFIKVETNQRVPCDMVFLRTTEKSGASFIRTDQLDGETDWKLRRSIHITQKLPNDEALLNMSASIFAEQPKKDIYSFIGNFTNNQPAETESISVENTLWANTVVASGNVIGCAIYTGRETRCVMNTSIPSTKVGLLDQEINTLSKLLFVLLCFLSFVMIAVKGFRGLWYIYLFRFILLFSSIIPISMRVNLDLGKTAYSFMMMRDKQIPGTVVRSSTIPEELGRIEYLLTDKTGTLTQNDMVFKKLHLGSISYTKDSLSDLQQELRSSYQIPSSSSNRNSVAPSRSRRNLGTKIKEAITAIALCHNVTPVVTDDTHGDSEVDIHEDQNIQVGSQSKFSQFFKTKGGYEKITDKKKVEEPVSSYLDDEEEEEDSSSSSSSSPKGKSQNYQASSPDEIALVKFTESIGLVLSGRELASITLKNPLDELESYEILNIFPFTSETKRMGIIVRDTDGIITFYMKGADAIMAKLVQNNDWLDEESGNMAREGLRTLAFGKRVMTEEEYHQFLNRYNQAKTSIADRAAKVQDAISTIEKDLELIALSGVEDKLQTNVKITLERLRNADVKVWMLTGDKIETATCIAISTKLVSRTQSLFTISVNDKARAFERLNQFSRMRDTCLIIDGPSLQMCLDNYKDQFIEYVSKAPSVVCCRCSPTQKADIVRLIKEKTKKRTCAIGDGGNDVSMIQAADVGVGIVGKEGKQASLAADFSITQFSYLSRLILWHGRNSYKRSASLSQFVIHRGLIISFIQCVFSAIYYFAALSIYNGMLLVGYATVYTNAPIFSLILDEDVSEEIAFKFPELYHELQKGRSLSYKTFSIWVLKSAYQGGIIMLLSIILFESSLNNIVSITFTALILCELLNVVVEIHRWHKYMILSLLGTLLIYVITMMIPQITAFELSFILSWEFVWKVSVITLVSCLPLYVIKFISRKVDPPSYTKLSSS
ncbi:ATPase [Heterostelium album PN500]|uniref:Phospholipid-transporting ATPase n=1 Tax=Heterostelium pallidum (strain ATCC 26659 / Pp 5 / PN500) TaxID=670386 RepID=D3B2A8_HETP5|nr:ATPase [Heterostelium album PN500]EFA84483.1 ATPase [Heterostelium album PN500]|eukprot:XP_020436597.1 ATPase [Heterostelium album PN500]